MTNYNDTCGLTDHDYYWQSLLWTSTVHLKKTDELHVNLLYRLSQVHTCTVYLEDAWKKEISSVRKPRIYLSWNLILLYTVHMYIICKFLCISILRHFPNGLRNNSNSMQYSSGVKPKSKTLNRKQWHDSLVIHLCTRGLTYLV